MPPSLETAQDSDRAWGRRARSLARTLLFEAALGLAVLCAPGCGASNSAAPTPSTVSVTGVTLSPASVSLAVGESTTLQAVVTPSQATQKSLAWTSADATVASVSASGLMTALKAGSTTITARSTDGSNRLSNPCAVTVSPVATPLSYTFENDTLGQAPAFITVLSGQLLVTSGPAGSTGKVLQDPSATQRSSANPPALSVGRLDLWGDPTSHDQVMTWRRWSTFSGAANIDGILLRSQAGTTVNTSAHYAGLTHGYLFLTKGQGSLVEIRRLGAGQDVLLGSAALAVGTFTHYRASAIGPRLRFEHSTDGLIWTPDLDLTDAVLPQATGRPLYVNGLDSWNPNTVFVDGLTLTDHILAVVPVTRVTLGQDTARGVQGSTLQLTWTVEPANATFPAVTFSSDDPSVASVSASGLLSFVSPGTCTVTAQGTGGTPDTLLVHTTDALGNVPAMKVGINFWNKNWEPDDTYFKTGITQDQWGAPGFVPWRPEFLSDLAIFNGPIRFMDWSNANSSPIQHWADRHPQNFPQYQSWYSVGTGPLANRVIAIDPALLAIPEVAAYYTSNGVPRTTYKIGDVSYEWMIDLCNRTGRDLWINIPAFANRDFMTQLATLIKTGLNPGLKVYVEYSNEYWNYISVATGYGYAEGARLNLPGPNKWYKGAAWCVFHSLEVFQAFQEVFGAENTGFGKRLIRVLAFSSDGGMMEAALRDVVYAGGPDKGFNPTWNPQGQKADVLAIAPYIGPYDHLDGNKKLDGADPQIAAKFRANVDWAMTNYVAPYRTLARTYGLPLVTYEGGQHLDTNAGAWSANPLIYDEYRYYLDRLNANGIKLLNHYTLYGVFSPGGAWGLKNDPAQPNTAAGGSPKYQAVKDWLALNP